MVNHLGFDDSGLGRRCYGSTAWITWHRAKRIVSQKGAFKRTHIHFKAFQIS